MHYDVKLSGARIRTHDLWTRKRVCYPLHHSVCDTCEFDVTTILISLLENFRCLLGAHSWNVTCTFLNKKFLLLVYSCRCLAIARTETTDLWTRCGGATVDIGRPTNKELQLLNRIVLLQHTRRCHACLTRF